MIRLGRRRKGGGGEEEGRNKLSQVGTMTQKSGVWMQLFNCTLLPPRLQEENPGNNVQPFILRFLNSYFQTLIASCSRPSYDLPKVNIDATSECCEARLRISEWIYISKKGLCVKYTYTNFSRSALCKITCFWLNERYIFNADLHSLQAF